MLKVLVEVDLYFNVCSKIEFYQCIDGFICWLDDVQYMFMCMNFVLIMCIFVDVWRDQYGEMFFVGWQRDWIMYLSISMFCGFYDFLG